MKRITIISLILISLLVGPVVRASDVSNAQYQTTITITNSGDTISNGIAVFDLSTPDMIDGGLLSSNASDCAMLTGTGGTDIASMPGLNSTWVTWVDNIGSQARLSEYLYHKGVTGGTIRYFPSDSGMTTADSASLELSDNFTIEISGWVDTDNGTDKNLIYKDNAFSLYVSDTVGGNITSSFGTSNWTSPTSFTDPASDWANESNAYDENITSLAYDNSKASAWLELNISAITYDRVRIIACDSNGGCVDNPDISVDVYYSGAWHNIQNGVVTKGIWVELSIGSFQTVTKARIKANAYTNAYLAVYEFDFGRGPQVTATGVSSGEHTIEINADGSNMTISIDGVVEDSVALVGASVPDNSENWTDFQNGAMPYIHYIKQWVGGNLRQHIEWEYDDTFTDLSGNGNDAIPTFRTAASDPDLTAEAELLSSLIEPSVPITTVAEGWNIIPSLPNTPTGLYDEGGYSFPGGAEIKAVAEGAGQNVETWLFAFAFGSALLVLIGVYRFTQNTRLGQKGSLLLACIAAEIVLVIFYRVTTIPGWTLIPFGLFSVLLVMWRKSPSPVD